MVSVFTSVLLLASIHFAAMLSPGPTALLVLRHGMKQHVKSMVPLVSGIVAATITNTFLTLVGVAAVIAASPKIALMLATLGSLYLLYLGANNILVAFRKFRIRAASLINEVENNRGTVGRCTPSALFLDGYLVNLLNPKIAVFYISIFSQVATPELPQSTLVVFSVQLVLQSLLYWSCFAALARAGVISRAMDKSNGWIDFAFGVALISFALYLFRSGL